MKTAWIYALVAAGMVALSAASFAAGSGTPRGVAVAAKLGVGLDELVACTNSARDQATEPTGSDARRTEMQSLVLACLQEDHPEITAAQFTAAVATVPAEAAAAQ
jgi:hypothetical protein